MSDKVDFYNSSGEAIPPYAVMQINDAATHGGRTVVTVGKPTGSDNEAGYLFNGQFTVPIGKTGIGYTASEPAWAYYDDGSTPSNGDDWGPENGSWKLVSGETGFRVIGGATDERVLVRLVGGGGAVKVIGPCVAYTPDMADLPTDFEISFPGGCPGPEAYGMNLRNLSTSEVQIIRLPKVSDGPLTFETDSFTFNCKSGSLSVYARCVFSGLSIGDVVLTIHLVSDDSVVQSYTNMLHSWDPLAGGNLQLAPDNTACDCGTLPFNICLAVPTE